MKFFNLIALLLFFHSAKSQDLIVTNKNDSINCKIGKIKNEYVHFTFRYKDEVRETLLSENEILSYKKGFYSFTEIPEGYKTASENYTKFDFHVGGGFSWLTAKVSEEVDNSLKEYIKELKSGHHLNLVATKYISENIGFSLYYSRFISKNSRENATYQTFGSTHFGKIQNTIITNFIAPALKTKIVHANEKTYFTTTFAMGYLGYRDKMSVHNEIKISGSSVGLIFDFGVATQLGNKSTLNFTLAFLAGSLGSVMVENNVGNTRKIDLPKDQRESLSRIDLTIGVGFF